MNNEVADLLKSILQKSPRATEIRLNSWFFAGCILASVGVGLWLSVGLVDAVREVIAGDTVQSRADSMVGFLTHLFASFGLPILSINQFGPALMQTLRPPEKNDAIELITILLQHQDKSLQDSVGKLKDVTDRIVKDE